MKSIVKYFLRDLIRGRIIPGYALLLLLISFSMYSLEENSSKATLGLMDLVLLAIPLVSIIYSTVYFFNSLEFVELLMTQPLKRSHILFSHYCSVLSALFLATFIGLGLPVLFMDGSETGFHLLLTAFFLTAICTSLAYLVAIRFLDKARAMGISILLWLFFTLIYDGLVLLFLFAFSDYPIENIMTGLVMFNPIDLGRIYILLHLDSAALMGFTGAVFQDFFGSSFGIFVSMLVLLAWTILPLWLAIRIFRRKDV